MVRRMRRYVVIQRKEVESASKKKYAKAGSPRLHNFNFAFRSVGAWERGYSSRFHVCTSHAPRPMTVVFGLGTRLRVRMRTTFENGVLRNGQQPSRAENSFIDQGEFVAMKTLSGCKAPRCDKHQFCD